MHLIKTYRNEKVTPIKMENKHNESLFHLLLNALDYAGVYRLAFSLIKLCMHGRFPSSEIFQSMRLDPSILLKGRPLMWFNFIKITSGWIQCGKGEPGMQ